MQEMHAWIYARNACMKTKHKATKIKLGSIKVPI